MTKRVRMIQDYKTRKKGETWTPTDRVAKQLVAGGFAAEVEEDDATEEEDPEPLSQSEDDEEEEQTSASVDETEEDAEEEEPEEPSASDEDVDEGEDEDDNLPPASQNASLDNVPASELANLDRAGIAPSITPHGLTQSAAATSPQRPAAAPLPARYAAHRSHIRPR